MNALSVMRVAIAAIVVEPGNLLGTADGPARVPVQAVIVSDDDGGRRARIAPEQFAEWVAFANTVFAAAGVTLSFDPATSVTELRNTAINDLAGAGDAGWPAVKKLGNEIAAGFPGRLVVFVRHGPGPRATGVGFSWHDYDFVVMPGFDDASHCGHPHVDALAHEIGHYLGLPHTFVGEPFADVAGAAAYFVAHDRDPRCFDGDGFADTVPDPAIRPLECERTARVDLDGRAFVLPRRNIMSYYDERDALSEEQIARVRWMLQRRQGHGMSMPRNRPGPGAIEAESLDVLETRHCATDPQPMDGFGAGDWSGGAQRFYGAGRDALVTHRLRVAADGTYQVVIHATLAPDFGVVQTSIDGRRLGEPIDLYGPVVLPTGAIDLGRVRLPAGDHRLTFEVTRKRRESTGYRFGIDAIELRK